MDTVSDLPESGRWPGTDLAFSKDPFSTFAKEGMLCRKQYWESVGKRARNKAWLDVFVVIQKGELNMFTFGENSPGASGAFGGGNWLVRCEAGIGAMILIMV
jgi:hypothetical protein